MGNYLLSNSTQAYYQRESSSGNYQFTSLDDIINYFMVAYVGEDKIISKASRTDVAFHAQRAMQELSFDTFKSVKSQEWVIPSSLRMMLPIDYVNYTNISWVDSAGIQHTIYPTSKTNNPQHQGNLVSNSSLNENADGMTLGTGWEWTNVTQTNDYITYGGAILGTSVAIGEKIKIPVNVKMGRAYRVEFRFRHPDPIDPTPGDETEQEGNLKITLYGDEGYSHVYGDSAGVPVYLPATSGNQGHWQADMALGVNQINFGTTTDTESQMLVIEPGDAAFTGIIDSIRVIDHHESGSQNGGQPNLISKTWSNYRSGTPSENQDDYTDDIYWPMDGSRYGLDPQYAQVNGSFFIDNNILHFSSNISGKTVVLKYISDSLGTTGELQVHKFAEEAMYKWIMHAVLSTRANIPEYQVNRLKKERFAAIRTAKLRLSNIKLEEITQILRGKSKQIKH